MSTHSPEWEMARAARAAMRDNAADRVTATLTLNGLAYEPSRYVAREAVEAIANWLTERGAHEAASLLSEDA